MKHTDSGPTSADVARHPIAVVAERSGLSPDVLRVWERRYAAVDPARTPGGQRLYSDRDIDRFRLLAAATRRGRNISLVAKLSSEELARLVAEDDVARKVDEPRAVADTHARSIESAMAHTHELDGSNLERVLRLAIARHGLSDFVDHVVPPLMRRIGNEWREGRLSVAHEHLATAVVLAIIFESMRVVPEQATAPRMLVATPSGERHAIGAALAALSASLDGWKVIYLGVDVPARDIVTAAVSSGAQVVALSVVQSENLGPVFAELRAIRDSLAANIPLVVGGAGAIAISAELKAAGLVVCESLAEMRAVFARDASVTGISTL